MYDHGVRNPATNIIGMTHHVNFASPVNIQSIEFIAIYTPRHTRDSYSFLMDKYLFSGDTFLINGTGRTDFQNGNYKGETVSTIRKEKKFNPRLQVRNVEEYIEIMKNLNLKKPAEIDFNVASNLKLGALI